MSLADRTPSCPRIVVLGSLVFDFVAKGDHLPRRGETVLGSFFGMFIGGKGGNQAVQAGRLGADTRMIGRVGADFLGDRVLESLRGSGVDTSHVSRDPARPTGACAIHVDAHGDNAIIIVPNASAACDRTDVDAARETVLGADVLLVQFETNVPVVAYAMDLARQHGIRIVLNPAPACPAPPELFEGVDYLTPNESEAEYYSGVAQDGRELESWCEAASGRLLDMGARNVVITLGERGCYHAAAGVRRLHPAFRIDAMDVTAAGDAFNAGLTVALGEGRPLEEALRWANAAGALCASRAGAQSSLAHRAEVEAFLAAHPRP